MIPLACETQKRQRRGDRNQNGGYQSRGQNRTLLFSGHRVSVWMVKTSWEWMVVVDGAQQCACISANQMYTSVVVNFSIMYVLPQRNLKKNHPACVLYLFHYEAVCLHEVPPSGLIRIAFSHQGSKGFLPFSVLYRITTYFTSKRTGTLCLGNLTTTN